MFTHSVACTQTQEHRTRAIAAQRRVLVQSPASPPHTPPVSLRARGPWWIRHWFDLKWVWKLPPCALCQRGGRWLRHGCLEETVSGRAQILPENNHHLCENQSNKNGLLIRVVEARGEDQLLATVSTVPVDRTAVHFDRFMCRCRPLLVCLVYFFNAFSRLKRDTQVSACPSGDRKKQIKWDTLII